MVRYIIYAITICALEVIIGYLNHRNNSGEKGKKDKQNDTCYTVRIPSALKHVYMMMFLVGIFLFVVFLMFKMKGNPTVTMGHLWFSLILAGIGLMVMTLASRWSINVNGAEIEIHRILHRKIKLFIRDIGDAKIGKKEEITLYDAKGKRITTVDGLSENYNRFIKTLKEYEKIK